MSASSRIIGLMAAGAAMLAWAFDIPSRQPVPVAPLGAQASMATGHARMPERAPTTTVPEAEPRTIRRVRPEPPPTTAEPLFTEGSAASEVAGPCDTDVRILWFPVRSSRTRAVVCSAARW